MRASANRAREEDEQPKAYGRSYSIEDNQQALGEPQCQRWESRNANKRWEAEKAPDCQRFGQARDHANSRWQSGASKEVYALDEDQLSAAAPFIAPEFKVLRSFDTSRWMLAFQ